jgi:hypothetical protein
VGKYNDVYFWAGNGKVFLHFFVNGKPYIKVKKNIEMSDAGIAGFAVCPQCCDLHIFAAK